MAFNVQSSLANALFAHERSAAAKARAHDKADAAKTTAKTTSMMDNAATERVTPTRFDELVSEKAPASTGPQKAAASSSSTANSARSRGAMPGRIAGHQDSVATPREESSDAPVESTAKEAGAKPDAAAAQKPDEAQREKPENAEAPGVSASGQDDAGQPKAEETANGDQQQGQEPGQQGDHQASGDQPQADAGTEVMAAPDDTVVTDAAMIEISPEAAALAGAAAVVNTTVVVPADKASAVAGEGAGVGGVSGDGAAATALASLAAEVAGQKAVGGDSAGPDGVATNPDAAGQTGDALPGSAGAAAANTGTAQESPAKIKATTAKIEGNAAKADNAQSTTPADTELPPGMAKHVLDTADQIAREARDGTIAKAAKGPGDVAAEGKTKAAGSNHASDGPVLRGAVFAQVLEDFTGAQGFSRGNDILNALDRPEAAAAQANRGVDVQRPTPLQMLPIEIGMQAVRGAREFQIRLDPAELGRVDVKLHINDKGEVNASMIVERPETLQMLRRDATTLAQAFEQAGLKQGENGMSFSLKGENQQGQQQHNARTSSVQDSDDAALQAQIGDIAMRRVMIPNSSLDRMV